MPRTINHEALISPLMTLSTRVGNRTGFEVLVRDRTGQTPIRCARFAEVYSTATPAETIRKRVQHALKAAYAAENVTTISSKTQWGRTFRFVFDSGDPDTVIELVDLPFIESGDLAN